MGVINIKSIPLNWNYPKEYLDMLYTMFEAMEAEMKKVSSGMDGCHRSCSHYLEIVIRIPAQLKLRIKLELELKQAIPTETMINPCPTFEQRMLN